MKEKIVNAIETAAEKTIYADGAQVILDAIVLFEALLTVVIAAVITGIVAYRGIAMLL